MVDQSNNKTGKNIKINGMTVINDKIEYDWFNLSTESYKIECKKNIHDLINQQLE